MTYVLIFQAVINSTVTPNMTFTKTSQKFGQWSDVRANTVYGLGFSSEAELNKVSTFKLCQLIKITFLWRVCHGFRFMRQDNHLWVVFYHFLFKRHFLRQLGQYKITSFMLKLSNIYRRRYWVRLIIWSKK